MTRSAVTVEVSALIERVADVVVRYGLRPEPHIDYVNRAIETATGFAPEEIYSDARSIVRLTYRDDWPLMDEVFTRDARDLRVVLRWVRKDRSTFWVEQRSTAVHEDGEVVAVEAIVREIADPTTGWRPSIRILGDVRIDLDRYRVLADGRLVRLTPSEFRLLVLLTDQPGTVLTRSAMVDGLWESAHVADARTCEVHISRLRSKLEQDPQHPAHIETVRGQGYRFVAR